MIIFGDTSSAGFNQGCLSKDVRDTADSTADRGRKSGKDREGWRESRNLLPAILPATRWASEADGKSRVSRFGNVFDSGQRWDNDSAYYSALFWTKADKMENKWNKWKTKVEHLNCTLGIYIYVYTYLIFLRLVVSISVRYISFNCLDVILPEKSDIHASTFLSLMWKMNIFLCAFAPKALLSFIVYAYTQRACVIVSQNPHSRIENAANVHTHTYDVILQVETWLEDLIRVSEYVCLQLFGFSICL